jgi:hypothetical protein
MFNQRSVVCYDGNNNFIINGKVSLRLLKLTALLVIEELKLGIFSICGPKSLSC